MSFNNQSLSSLRNLLSSAEAAKTQTRSALARLDKVQDDLNKLCDEDGKPKIELMKPGWHSVASDFLSRKATYAVCGANSSGKTSFLQVLLDADGLPAGEGNVTGRILQIEYATAANACVFEVDVTTGTPIDGTCISLTGALAKGPDELTAALKPFLERPDGRLLNNWLSRSVTLRIDREVLRSGVVLVDLPGFNENDSPAVGAALKAYFERRKPALLFCYSNPSFAESECGVLTRLLEAYSFGGDGELRLPPRVFFVSTHADLTNFRPHWGGKKGAQQLDESETAFDALLVDRLKLLRKGLNDGCEKKLLPADAASLLEADGCNMCLASPIAVLQRGDVMYTSLQGAIDIMCDKLGGRLAAWFGDAELNRVKDVATASTTATMRLFHAAVSTNEMQRALDENQRATTAALAAKTKVLEEAFPKLLENIDDLLAQQTERIVDEVSQRTFLCDGQRLNIGVAYSTVMSPLATDVAQKATAAIAPLLKEFASVALPTPAFSSYCAASGGALRVAAFAVGFLALTLGVGAVGGVAAGVAAVACAAGDGIIMGAFLGGYLASCFKFMHWFDPDSCVVNDELKKRAAHAAVDTLRAKLKDAVTLAALKGAIEDQYAERLLEIEQDRKMLGVKEIKTLMPRAALVLVLLSSISTKLERSAWLEFGCQLGNGGFGTVYEVRGDATLAMKRVAMFRRKVLEEETALKEEAALEVAMLMMVRGMPGVVELQGVQLYGCGTRDWLEATTLLEERDLFLELIEERFDGSLARYLTHNMHSLTEDRAVQLMLQVARGVAALHSQHITHRDIKCENVLVRGADAGLQCVLADFGLSTPLPPHSGCGTTVFVAPEVRARDPNLVITPARDIYELGMVMWELVPKSVFWRACDGRVDLAALPSPPLPELVQLIDSCRAHKPSDRPTANAVVSTLKELAARARAGYPAPANRAASYQ
jgi:hypothetical protein